MRIFCFIILTLLAQNKSFAQKTEKVYLDKNDNTSNCYLAIYPNTLPLKGFMFLIPGFGETPEDVQMQTDLSKLAAEQGILTVIPMFKTGVKTLGIDNLTQQSFREMIEDITGKNKLIDTKFYVGGFSIGGSCVVKFAELAVKDNFKYKPNAVFVIDPPLDFERFYKSNKRTLRLSVNSNPSQEVVYMVDRIEKEMNGTPETAIQNYYKYSPYSFSDTKQTAIKYLINTPIRFYTEPDINWWLNERGGDYSGMNALDGSCMINELNRLGNKNAFLITTQNKGYRKPDHKRHPHSWSIVDNDELVKWLLSQK
jgi:esterase/lipase